jgi:hypothetical protein
MSTVEEIKAAIEQLTFEQRSELARWMHGWEDDEWDKQIATDAQAGRLDKLLKEVDEDINAGRLRDLP